MRACVCLCVFVHVRVCIFVLCCVVLRVCCFTCCDDAACTVIAVARAVLPIYAVIAIASATSVLLVL